MVRLLRSSPDPGAPALGRWTIAEVAVHLSQAWMAVPGLAARDLSEIHAVLPALETGPGPSMIRDLWDLGGVTRSGVEADPERDLTVLAQRIETSAGAYLATLDHTTPDETRAWMVEGAEVAMGTLTCHLLNETIVHGWDLAQGAGRPWPIKPAHAALVVDGFLIPVFQALGPRAMVDQEQAAGLHVTYEVRVRGCGRHVFIFDDGALSIEGPSRRPVDCYIDADPVAFLLVAWGRRGLGAATAARELVVSGPKAWLGPRFRSLMRNP